MKKRWKMNRIGFVNFWLYDEETFDFADGKLLLRGQNGSGKSITTQSFIPFILDGDRTPSRLDPFGSSDRKMEYYFLGEGEDVKEEATGYLFLEFKRDGEEEYRTIGIGQRAKRGRPMDFWGFIITDGRRIGYDLCLYKNVGSNKIPYDKREMKNLIGENNFFTENQGEYKKNVNQYIFGFRKDEQYEQYIKLLVKVRAPKLSKEFKPTKVYEILNDSLQTLTDEDLRAMVEAMEKMDEIQDSLEMLNRAYTDVKSIRNEYTRYNQYMLAKKAQRYIDRKNEYETTESRLNELMQEKLAIEREYSDKEKHSSDVEEQIKLVTTERNSLFDTNLEDIDRKLEEASKQKKEEEYSEKKWDDKIQEYNARIRVGEQSLEDIIECLEDSRQQLLEQKQELEEAQTILQWEEHDADIKLIGEEKSDSIDAVIKSAEALKKLMYECKKIIIQYSELEKQYDELAIKLEKSRKAKEAKEDELEKAQSNVIESIDRWIEELFANKENAQEWKPGNETLKEAEQLVRQYKSVDDAGIIQELLRADYERQRQVLIDARSCKENDKGLRQSELEQTRSELDRVQKQEELEPVRCEAVQHTRKALEAAGIKAVSFYKTVEFADDMEPEQCAVLEAQLEAMGMLDALVVSEADIDRIDREFPEFIDTVISVNEVGSSEFSRLVVSEKLDEGIRKQVIRILSNIYDSNMGTYTVTIGKEGSFRQGILAGRAFKNGEAEYIGVLARKRRKEQRIAELNESIVKIQENIQELESEIDNISGRIGLLAEEYQRVPGFAEIARAIADEGKCSMELQHLSEQYEAFRAEEHILADNKNRQYQLVIKECRRFPYGRTVEAYEEAEDALNEYCDIWRGVKDTITQINIQTSNRIHYEQQVERDKYEMDNALTEKRSHSIRIKQFDIQIKQYEDYLNSPEIKEKSRKLKELKIRLDNLDAENERLKLELARLDERLKAAEQKEPEIKAALEKAVAQETQCRDYFDEELSLKLVIQRAGRTLYDCALEAVGALRDSDKNREAGELLQSLYSVFQKHNASLSAYGTALEECFDSMDEPAGDNILRKRVRVVSVWNGKKVFLEEFYNILKTTIEETELLIQQKDRELFEDILSQTISQQLTDRIAESRRWVADMSQLMKEMDTSMGLSFSLDWKPCKAENDSELDTSELEMILLRDRSLLSVDDIEKVASHFRSKIRLEKQHIEENGGVINYMDLVREALDYRRWFEFQMFYRRGEETKKPLTNAAFNRFSGGEKAMAMYVPLFAAVNAQYKKAENEDHPRMVALDEAFAGVDDKNISSMFELVHKLDFDYIMNSQALWGCFDTVRQLKIAELLRPQNSQIVTVIRYTWNGRERILDEQ